jgi:hypothetical protein
MNLLQRALAASVFAWAANAQTLGVNHYGFGDGDTQLLSELSPVPVPLRMTFYWHDVAGAADYYDPQVAAATQAGVPILGILGYSAMDESSIPLDFDFTEISPFNISWHTRIGPLPWGSAGVSGTAKYLWNTTLEDGRPYSRVVEVAPSGQGGFIHGEIDFQVPHGHSVVLWARVGFRHDTAKNALANFSVTYLKGTNFPSLASLEKGHDGTLATLSADISSLAGSKVKLFFNVDPVCGYSTAGAVWQSAGILVDGVPLSMRQVVGKNLQAVINYPPKDTDEYAAYAGDLARRYPQIQAWEVWNEPNTSFFWRPAVNAKGYTHMLEKTYRALKAANPNAKVILGGLSPGHREDGMDAVPAADFLNRVYESGGGAFFDAVAYHAYGEGAPKDWLADALLGIRDVMDAHGDIAKPVWITEMGCYTHGLGAVTEAWQANYLRDSRIVLARIPSVERVYWYTLRDANQSADPEKNYGLFRANGTPKPAVQDFAAPLD